MYNLWRPNESTCICDAMWFVFYLRHMCVLWLNVTYLTWLSVPNKMLTCSASFDGIRLVFNSIGHSMNVMCGTGVYYTARICLNCKNKASTNRPCDRQFCQNKYSDTHNVFPYVWNIAPKHLQHTTQTNKINKHTGSNIINKHTYTHTRTHTHTPTTLTTTTFYSQMLYQQ